MSVQEKITYDLELALTYTSAIIRSLGYVSKKKSMEGSYPQGAAPVPTSLTLARWLKANPDGSKPSDLVKPHDAFRATEALAWLDKLSPTNEFYQSLKNLVTGGYWGRGEKG